MLSRSAAPLFSHETKSCFQVFLSSRVHVYFECFWINQGELSLLLSEGGKVSFSRSLLMLEEQIWVVDCWDPTGHLKTVTDINLFSVMDAENNSCCML